MISREYFSNALNKLQTVNSIAHRANSILDELKSDFTNIWGLLTVHDDLIINLLAEIVDDKEKFIEWWVYETDFGQNEKYNKIYFDDGRELVLDSPEKLYDYIISLMKE